MKCSQARADWRFNAPVGSSVVGSPCPEQPVADSYTAESRGESFADASEAIFEEPAAPIARAILSELGQRARSQYVSPFALALVHTGLGERQPAIASLERAYKEREWYLCVLKTEPTLDSLRPDPRFQDLLRRLNFTQD